MRLSLRELEIREEIKDNLKFPVRTRVGATAASNQTHEHDDNNDDFTPSVSNIYGME